MASSSNNTFTEDDPFDQAFDQSFENMFETMCNTFFPPPKEKKNKRKYIERNRELGHQRLFNDYFSEDATYPASLFRRRFRMNKSLFETIVNGLFKEVAYFQEGRDATGRISISALVKCTAAIRMMAYGCTADQVDEYLRLGDTTAHLCLENFVEGVIFVFGEKYLRRPTADDLQRLLNVAEERGFPGMIGSIDCMHWEWKNCPVPWKGQYTHGSGKPTIVLEAVASYDLWIWHAFFGLPGTLNDINVLQRSPVFDDIIEGRAPKVNYWVNGHKYKLAYYLTDGIYPNWATFMQSIKIPQNPVDCLFASYQEHYRKDVERAFGVLQAQFAIVKNPALSWDKVKIGNIMKACIILHNMIVEDERDGYTLGNVSEFHQQTGDSNAQVEYNDVTRGVSINIAQTLANRFEVHDSIKHQHLKTDLVNHIW